MIRPATMQSGKSGKVQKPAGEIRISIARMDLLKLKLKLKEGGREGGRDGGGGGSEGGSEGGR
jgi:hypothetical protein